METGKKKVQVLIYFRMARDNDKEQGTGIGKENLCQYARQKGYELGNTTRWKRI